MAGFVGKRVVQLGLPIIAVLAMGPVGAGDSTEFPPVLGTVGRIEITLDEVQELARPELERIRQNQASLLTGVLDDLVDDLLVVEAVFSKNLTAADVTGADESGAYRNSLIAGQRLEIEPMIEEIRADAFPLLPGQFELPEPAAIVGSNVIGRETLLAAAAPELAEIQGQKFAALGSVMHPLMDEALLEFAAGTAGQPKSAYVDLNIESRVDKKVKSKEIKDFLENEGGATDEPKAERKARATEAIIEQRRAAIRGDLLRGLRETLDHSYAFEELRP